MTPEQGYQEALRQIEEAHCKGAIMLDLSELQLMVIPMILIDCSDLQTLDLSRNQISVLEYLPAGLQTLYLSSNRISVLENLPDGLQTLDLSFNQISVLENLPDGLQLLDLSSNQISKLKSLPDGLQSLYLNWNQISVLENLPDGLQTLDLSSNQISVLENLPEDLKKLYLFQNETNNIPSELLGNSPSDNCLYNVRAWFTDLEKESAPNQAVKFMVSGNSNVGKSSLIEALLRGKTQPEQDSTHGIRIEPLPLNDGTQQIEGIAFDFGGQEIYHGTHQLFLRSRAVQLVVFDAETEAAALTLDRRGLQAETNRNKTLPNWLSDLQRLSPASAFVLVQNKIELHAVLPPATQVLINQVDSDQEAWTSRVSAWSGRNIAALRGTLFEAAKSIPEYGMLMPSAWLAVRGYFLANSQKSLPDRERIVPLEFFDQLCTECNVLSDSERVLLRYLHNTGVVYYDETRLKEVIIADQQWAIEAIYEVLDRKGRLYDELANETFGKKRLNYLFGYFNATFTTAERGLFVNLMESCGLCFPLIEKRNGKIHDDTYYLFPQFLPDSRPDSVSYFLSGRAGQAVYTQQVAFLPYYHIQQLIVRWGVKTDIRNIWRTGFLANLSTEGRFVLEADLETNTLTFTPEHTIPDKTIIRLLRELGLGHQEIEWHLDGINSVPESGKESVEDSSRQVVESVPDIVQPKIRRLVVSYAKEDARYVDLLRKKLAARKIIDLWYDRYITGWEDWDTQIKHQFTDCDGYIVFLSDTYMDAETKAYIHEKEIPVMCQRFNAGHSYGAVINITSYNTQHTDLARFLQFRKGALMPCPDKLPAEASDFLEAFINEKLFGDFLYPNL